MKAWKDHQTTTEAQHIVEVIYKFSKLADLSDNIDKISITIMETTRKRKLRSTIRKVSRYRDVSTYLCRMARKYPIVRNLRFIPVGLPAVAFEKNANPPANIHLAVALEALPLEAAQRGRLGELWPMLKLSPVHAQNKYAKVYGEDESKIHAEVQLVYHCETNITHLRPRVLASCKDACFLCNAFIQLHAGFHMSRSHGRLYPKWRLPNLPLSSDIKMRLSGFLEKQIIQTINLMLTKRQRLFLVDPTESTASTWVTSTTSTHENENETNLVQIIKEEDVVVGTDKTPSEAKALCEVKPPREEYIEGGPSLVKTESKVSVSPTPLLESISSKAVSLTPIELSVASSSVEPSLTSLQKGIQKTISVAANSTTPFYEASPIRLQLEREGDTEKQRKVRFQEPPTITSPEDSTTVTLEWLDMITISELCESKDVKIIDLDLMGDCVEMTREELSQACLYARGSFLKVRLDQPRPSHEQTKK